MRVLLAIDDSRYSNAAIHQVIAQLTPRDSEVRVLHVIEPDTTYPDGQAWGFPAQRGDVTADQRRLAEGLVSRAAQRLRDAGFAVVTSVEAGEPRVLILNTADEWRAELIVVGSHGRKGLDHFLLGSVSEAVARNARCSVEIARLPES